MTTTITHDEFVSFMRTAKRGQRIVYHRGSLVDDRAFNSQVAKLADFALEQYQAGRLELIQKRLGKEIFEYIAVKQLGVPKRAFTECYSPIIVEET